MRQYIINLSTFQVLLRVQFHSEMISLHQLKRKKEVSLLSKNILFHLQKIQTEMSQLLHSNSR